MVARLWLTAALVGLAGPRALAQTPSATNPLGHSPQIVAEGPRSCSIERARPVTASTGPKASGPPRW